MMLHVVGPVQEKQELEEKIRATVSDIIKNWGDEEKGYTCNDCYLAMQNCHERGE